MKRQDAGWSCAMRRAGARRAMRLRGVRRFRAESRGHERLEARELLAGDLIANWRAENLAAGLNTGDLVPAWVDTVRNVTATAVGSPRLVEGQIGGRAAVRFDASDGNDALVVSLSDSPMSGVNDFTVVVAFASASTQLSGGQGDWFQNTGLVDGSNLGFTEDWGVSLNATGRVSAGLGSGFGNPPQTLYSTATNLNDGQLHIATFTHSGSQMSLYVDGLPADSRNDASSRPRARLQMAIGRLTSDRLPFTGDIAEVRVYNGALTSTEVASLVASIAGYYANQAPMPVDDHFVLDEDQPFFAASAPGVLSNDTDADGDALKAILVDPPAHGTIILQENGSFIYDSARNFFGTDSFTYRAHDFRDSPTIGRVTLEVRPKYDPAEGVVDEYKSQPDAVLIVSALSGVLANDQNIDQAPLTVQLHSPVTAGQLTLNSDGGFRYDPQGFHGTATFAYRINDQATVSSPITVTFVVNTPPATLADSYTLSEDSVFTRPSSAGVLANDRDADSDSMTATLETAPTIGALTLRPDGGFDYTPPADFHGAAQFSYRVTDGVDISPPVSVQLSVTPVNDLPIAADDAFFALPGQVLAVPAADGLLSNDQDVEDSPLSAIIGELPQHGQLTLAPDGGFRYTPNAEFDGVDSFTYRASDGEGNSAPATVRLTVTSQPVVINEIMASNAETLTTIVRKSTDAEFQGEVLTPDWIELRNVMNQPVNLSGLFLTDDPSNLNKWQFPVGTLVPASGHLLIFASGLDVRDPALDQKGSLHTNFQLNPDGEYLALVNTLGEAIHAFAPDYPAQRTHISYGLNDQREPRYFTSPTPGTANGVGAVGVVSDTRFSVGRGFYSQPFSLEITTDTLGATIRYTIDGSVPTETSGNLYQGPITIGATTTVRVRAFLDGLVPTNTDTNSYVFSADVVNQTSQQALDAGFPARWRTATPDYGLDGPEQFPLIAGDRNMPLDAAKLQIQESLVAIPSLSLVMNLDDMFGAERGIYSNPTRSGPAWERPTSVELIHPDGTTGFQIDAGIRIQGGAFRDFGLTHKKSFRLMFKTKYGPSSLQYPLFGAGAADEFQTLTLRMEANDGWQWGDAGGQPQYTRDEFLRRTQLAMGQPAPHGTNFHLYINGMYWGMYNVVERPDESFGAAYFGSEPYAWDGQNSGTPINADGDTFRAQRSRDAWRTLSTLTDAVRTAASEDAKTAAYMKAQGLHADGTDDPSLERFLDPVNYSDYLIANYYGGNADWPFKNYYFGRENSPDSEGFKFFMWDAEWSLFLRSNQGTGLINDVSGVADPWRDLKTSLEFRTLFGDRVHKHFFNGGPLYVDPANPDWDPEHPERNRPAAQYVEVRDMVYGGLIAESARWGDQHRNAPYTRDVEWQREFDRIMTTWFPRRSAELLRHFKTLNLYPDVDVPTFNQRGGIVAADFDITLTAPAGEIYYTLDGSDPRAIGGAIGAGAIRYQGPFRLASSMTVKVRALNGVDWSAIDEAAFLSGVVPASSANLRISELHYHPADLTPRELAAGYGDPDEFEFIEFVNISSQTIDLRNACLESMLVGADEHGVRFEFANSAIQQLAPGARLVVVENLNAFALRYGDGIPVAGAWDGGLSNDSEIITVMTGDQILQQFTYDDSWYANTDGGGPSLEHNDPSVVDLAVWNDAAGWHASRARDGSPGLASAPIPGDSNLDGLFNSSDLVRVLQSGEYEDAVAGNSTFVEGDWNADGDFTTADLILAFQQGNYVAGSRWRRADALSLSPYSVDDAERDRHRWRLHDRFWELMWEDDLFLD